MMKTKTKEHQGNLLVSKVVNFSYLPYPKGNIFANIKMFVIILLVFIFLSCVVGVYLSNMPKPKQNLYESRIDSVTTPSPFPTANWLQYTSKHNNVSFLYPSENIIICEQESVILLDWFGHRHCQHRLDWFDQYPRVTSKAYVRYKNVETTVIMIDAKETAVYSWIAPGTAARKSAAILDNEQFLIIEAEGPSEGIYLYFLQILSTVSTVQY